MYTLELPHRGNSWDSRPVWNRDISKEVVHELKFGHMQI